MRANAIGIRGSRRPTYRRVVAGTGQVALGSRATVGKPVAGTGTRITTAPGPARRHTTQGAHGGARAARRVATTTTRVHTGAVRATDLPRGTASWATDALRRTAGRGWWR